MGDPKTYDKTRGADLNRGNIVTRFSGLILYVLITVLVVSLYGGKYGFLEDLATRMQDGMFTLRGKSDAPPSDVIIVGIDDRSVDNIARWPWPRDLLGQLIFLIGQDSPQVMGLDLFLSEDIDEDTSGRTDFLADEISTAGNVVLPIYFGLSDAGIAPKLAPEPVMRSAVDDTKTLREGKSSLIYARQIYHPDPALVEASSGFGHINIEYDADGLVRREPLLINYDGYLYPSLGLQIASAHLGVRPEQIRPEGEDGLEVGETVIPTDKKLRMLVNYRGPDLRFERVSAINVFTGQVDPETFRGKIVLVGLTSTESKTWIDVPSFGRISEVERIATITENILHRDFLRHLPAFWNVLALILIGFFCALILPNVSVTYRIVILMVFLFVVFNFSYILFSSFGILTKPIYPIVELLFFLAASPAIRPKQSREKTSEAPALEIVQEETTGVGGTISDGAEEQPPKLQQDESSPVAVGEPETGKDSQLDLEVKRSETDLTDHALKARPKSSVGPSAEKTVRLDRTPLPDATPELASTTPTAGSELAVSRFGRYQIVEALGKGGMGTVYKGLDPALDRPVALKTIRLDFALSSSEISELRERLVQEAKAAGRLSHPNIVTIYDVGEQGGLQYIAMEYLSGHTLEDFIKKKGVLNYRIVAKIIMQTCEALSYAHRHGIIHRDIKPGNIMLLEAACLTRSNVALGTPHYIAPEQLDGRPADKRSDIFSLGVVIYELLTGRKPFQSENISSLMYRILNHQPPPPSSVDEKTPLIFDQIVSKAMAKNPEDRYQDSEEIGRVMREFISSFVVTRSIRI